MCLQTASTHFHDLFTYLLTSTMRQSNALNKTLFLFSLELANRVSTIKNLTDTQGTAVQLALNQLEGKTSFNLISSVSEPAQHTLLHHYCSAKILKMTLEGFTLLKHVPCMFVVLENTQELQILLITYFLSYSSWLKQQINVLLHVQRTFAL